jgi:hypothetical protein
MQYAMKPMIVPAIAMPPLAATEPVKKKPINIIVKKPETCQVMAFVRSLILLSMK